MYDSNEWTERKNYLALECLEWFVHFLFLKLLKIYVSDPNFGELVMF